jgi:zinc transport system substrate-binding protein
MKIKQITLTTLLAIILILGVTFAIRGKQPAKSDKLNVVASYYPLYEFAKHVGGDRAQITNVTPAGAEPHDYEPSASALVNAQKSDLFIFNGGTLEPWTNKFIYDYHKTTVMAGHGISMRVGNDPHFWLDPVLAARFFFFIRNGFIKADPGNKDYYTRNAADYNKKLAQLNIDFAAGLKTCSQDTVISSHGAFVYLADRYNFNVEAIAGISPENEPSADRLAQISKIVKEKGIRYIFFESLVSPRLADTIAQETGAKTLVFDPIEGLTNEDQRQGKNYISVQRENLAALRTALTCQ